MSDVQVGVAADGIVGDFDRRETGQARLQAQEKVQGFAIGAEGQVKLGSRRVAQRKGAQGFSAGGVPKQGALGVEGCEGCAARREGDLQGRAGVQGNGRIRARLQQPEPAVGLREQQLAVARQMQLLRAVPVDRPAMQRLAGFEFMDRDAVVRVNGEDGAGAADQSGFELTDDLVRADCPLRVAGSRRCR